MSAPRYEALAIGGSAGSMPVVAGMLAGLPADCALAVVVCLHTASRDADDICGVFARRCALPVVEAGERDAVHGGRVHVACGGYHLLVEHTRRFSLCAGERHNYARPSIDVTFETMAEAYRERLVGVLVSGANHDGAAGLQRIQALGGLTIVQRPDDAVAPQMPTAALALFTPDRQYTADELSATGSELARFAG